MAQVTAGTQFASRLVAAREAMGLSQERLANQHLEVTKATVGNWETGKTLPGYVDLARCCDTFGWDRAQAFEWLVEDEIAKGRSLLFGFADLAFTSP